VIGVIISSVKWLNKIGDVPRHSRLNIFNRLPSY